jgi:hypothetical protein
MGKFLLSNQIPERNIAADGVFTYDLGVRPTSAVLINLRPLNDTGTLANWNNAIRIASAINRVTVLWRGQAIHSMTGADLVAFNWLRWGMLPHMYASNDDDTNNERRVVTVPVVMGRFPFDPQSCFPAPAKGELTVELDLDIADTGYDTLNLSIDTLELPDARPREFEKRVQQSLTFSATGNNDMDLPVGNLIRGMLLWGTTGYVGATPAPSWGSVSVLLDNQEVGFRSMDFEVLSAQQALLGRLGLNPTEDDHLHRVTTDGNAQAELTTLGGGGHGPTGAGTYRNYAFLDFDPTGDDMFALDTKTARRLQIRANAETADAVRCVPIEVIKV